MLKFYFFTAFSVIFAFAHAQDSLIHKPAVKFDSIVNHQTQSVDSLQKKLTHRSDTINKVVNSVNDTAPIGNKSLDSLQKNFHHRTDSLQKSFATPLKELDSKISKLKHKKDSLSHLNLSTASVSQDLDSLQQAQSAKLKELNTRIDKVKKETLAKASALQLPLQAQGELSKLTGSVNSLSVSDNFFKMPKDLGMSGLGNVSSLNLPSSVSNTSLNFGSSANIPSMNGLGSLGQTPSLSQVQGATQELSQVQSATSLESAEKMAAKELSQNSEAKSLLNEEMQVKDMQGQLAKVKDAKSAEGLAQEQLKPAINHFAGKEQELKTAMDQVSKLKQKYSSVKSLAELPKRAPNPLKGKPWIERIIPGLNYYVQNKHYTLVDFNPYVGWRFTPKLAASIGWNQRVGVSNYSFATNKYDRLYGLRSSVSYVWTHGITFKASPEVMKAYVPTSGTPDIKHQALVWGIYGGIRKDFPIYKSVKGYSEALYNFNQKPHQNIYGDRVSFRFGIEVQLKKKPKKEKIHGADSIVNQYKSSFLKRPTMLGNWMEEIRKKKMESKKYTALLKQRFTKREIRSIKKKNSFIGMSEEALYHSLGNPIETYVTNISGATKKQCVYQNGLTVFLVNSKVSGLQKAKSIK